MENKKVENKKQMSNKKKFWVGMSALAAVGVITATVAYFTTWHSFDNPFKIAKTSVTISELYDTEAASHVVPGETIPADVSICNNSTDTVPIMARIKYVQKTDGKDFNNWSSDDFVNAPGLNLTTYFGDSSLWQANFSESDVSGFEQVPGAAADGFYYYKGVINPEETVHHLESLTLKTTATPTNTSTENYTEGTGWSTGDGLLGNGVSGARKTEKTVDTYDGEIYVYVETTQATDGAGNMLTSDDINSAGAAKEAWSHPVAEPGV